MKKLLNTLYVTTEDAYLSLNGETVEVVFTNDVKKNIPIHTLNSIVCFSYKGASPALMGKCAEAQIHLSFYSPRGRFLASVINNENGNVLLRRTQYRVADSPYESLDIARNMIYGKLYNSKYVLYRATRDHPLQVDCSSVSKSCENISKYMNDVKNADSLDVLRGIEGNSAAEYFSVFDEMILQNKAVFKFNGRNRRPATDNVNALLSFAYSLLANECASALQGVGLDPYVGFIHTDRPGRKSLALDLEEELRSVFADRFVLYLINNRILSGNDFEKQESGAVFLTDDGRKRFLSEWQKRKKEYITHPFLDEKIEWGLVPHIQALLLARFLRGDIDGYPPFFWK